MKITIGKPPTNTQEHPFKLATIRLSRRLAIVAGYRWNGCALEIMLCRETKLVP